MNWASFYKAAGAILEISLSLQNLNRNQVKLVQIRETHYSCVHKSVELSLILAHFMQNRIFKCVLHKSVCEIDSRCQSYKNKNPVQLQKKWHFCNKLECFVIRKIKSLNVLQTHKRIIVKLQKTFCEFYRIGPPVSFFIIYLFVCTPNEETGLLYYFYCRVGKTATTLRPSRR